MACQYYPPGPVNYLPYDNSYQGVHYYQNQDYLPCPPPNIPPRRCDYLWIPPHGPGGFNPYMGPPQGSQHIMSHGFRPPVQINHCIPPQRPRYFPPEPQYLGPPYVPLGDRNWLAQFSGRPNYLSLVRQYNLIKASEKALAEAIAICEARHRERSPPPSSDNSRSRAPQKRVTSTAPSTPHTPVPEDKDTCKNVMPAVHPKQDFGAQDAQVSDPDMLQRFVYSIDEGKTLHFVDPEDEVVLDLAVLCKNAFKNARRSPPSYKCPCCVGLGLPDVDHRMLTTCDINGERRQKIVCPNLLAFFKKFRASTGGGKLSS